MKVGIVTFQSAHNYGAVLQCWSLQEYLKSCGHDVDVINFRPDVIDKVYALVKVPDVNITDSKKINAVLKRIRGVKYKFDNRKRFPGRIEKFKKFEKFIETKLNVTEPYYTVKEVRNANLRYDILIAGSDQIWNPGLTKGYREPYFLSFGNKDAVRIAYAASIGTDDIDDSSRMFMQRYLDDFDKISVRETASKEVIESLISMPVEVTVDPTFLARMDSFKKLEINPNASEPYIYVHNVHLERIDKNLMAMAKAVSERLNLPIIHNRTDYHFKKELRAFSGGVEEYLGLIHNAECVITNSFHTTVFAIRYKRQFVSVPHFTSPGRVNNLLGNLNLLDHFISSPKDLPKDLKNWDIDYDSVTDKMQGMADKSAEFLNNAIQSEKKEKEYSYLHFNNTFKCYGCGACEQASEDGSIKMEKDRYGFSYPVRDEASNNGDNPAGCDVCPRLHPGLSAPEITKVYAAYAKDEGEYEQGTMGSVLAPIFGEILKRDGVIIGPKIDENFNVVYSVEDTADGCMKLLNPTFVMPENKDILKKTKDILEKGKQVLFLGATCQVSGLKNYLGKQYDNLITIDGLCRGVGSPEAFKKYLENLMELHDSKITDIRLGYKLKDSDLPYVRILFENGGMEFVRYKNCNYINDISTNNLMMPSCYECQFLDPETSVTDITVGDYSKIKNENAEFGKNKGISLMKINSNKGLELFEAVKDKLVLQESSIDELKKLNNTDEMKLSMKICNYIKHFGEEE